MAKGVGTGWMAGAPAAANGSNGWRVAAAAIAILLGACVTGVAYQFAALQSHRDLAGHPVSLSRMEVFEARLIRIEDKLDVVLTRLNAAGR